MICEHDKLVLSPDITDYIKSGKDNISDVQDDFRNVVLLSLGTAFRYILIYYCTMYIRVRGHVFKYRSVFADAFESLFGVEGCVFRLDDGRLIEFGECRLVKHISIK